MMIGRRYGETSCAQGRSGGGWVQCYNEKGRTQGVSNVLQGGITSDINIWFRDLGPFGGNGKEGRRSTHIFSQTDHKEASAEDSRQDMGDAQGGSSVGRGGNIFGNDLYR